MYKLPRVALDLAPVAEALQRLQAEDAGTFIYEARDALVAKGATVLGEPRIGAHGTLIIFVHPKDMGGLLVELMETPKEAHH